MIVVAWVALTLVTVGLAVAWPALFGGRYMWERLPWMRAERNVVTGRVVTDLEIIFGD